MILYMIINHPILDVALCIELNSLGADSSVSKVSDSQSDGLGFDSRPRLELYVQTLASCFALVCTQSTQLQMSTGISSGNNNSGWRGIKQLCAAIQWGLDAADMCRNKFHC